MMIKSEKSQTTKNGIPYNNVNIHILCIRFNSNIVNNNKLANEFNGYLISRLLQYFQIADVSMFVQSIQ